MGLDGPMLTIATANVNGIRAAYKKGMGAWVASRRPDVLLLQEVRAPDEMVGDFLPPAEWDFAHEACEIKGRAGVAIASRLPMSAIRIGLATGVPVDTGRWVEADLELPAVDGGAPRTLTVVSAYIHSGQAGTSKMDEKYAFLDHVTARLGELAEAGGLVVVGEVGLAGEVRPVQGVERRLAEAARLGFTHALAPTNSGRAPSDMQVTEVDELRHAIAAAFRHAVIPLRRPTSN